MPIPREPLPAPNATVTVTADTPVFLMPDRHRVPLRVLPAGAAVTFLEADGAWYHVSFHDPQWGTRYGFLDGNFVDPSKPVELGARERVHRPVPAVQSAAAPSRR